MSFDYSHTVTTSAAPSAVWALWSDCDTWAMWDPAVQRVSLDGEFETGAGGTMVLTGGIEAAFSLEAVEPGRRYLDQVSLGDLVIRIDHVVEPAEGGAEVTVRTTIEGPGAEDIGPLVTADAPQAMAALVDLAERPRAAESDRL